MKISCKQCGYDHKTDQTCLEVAHKRGGLEEAVRIGELLLQRDARTRKRRLASFLRKQHRYRGPITAN